MPDSRFFDFLQLAVGQTDIFTYSLIEEDWQNLFDLCRKHALIGIGFCAVERLHGLGVECPYALKMRWMSLVIQIERKNGYMNAACGKVSARFVRDGFDCCVLKGQGNLLNYPKCLACRRQAGDIDLWVMPHCGRNSVKPVISYVRKCSKQYQRAVWHHIDMAFPDMDIDLEIHYRPGYLRSFIRDMRMRRWFRKRSDECMGNNTSLGFAVPTSSVNVVYQMSHIFSHVFEEGVGLRQLLDYYFVLLSWDNARKEKCIMLHGDGDENTDCHILPADEIMRVVSSLGMAKFAAAVMYVLQQVFAMPDDRLLCVPDEKRGKHLLDEIMLAGNFGQYDRRDEKMRYGGTVSHGMWKLKRVMLLLKYYPEEALCEPFFRVWHLGWRCFH